MKRYALLLLLFALSACTFTEVAAPPPTATRAPSRAVPTLPSTEVVVPTFPPRNATPGAPVTPGAGSTPAAGIGDAAQLAIAQAFDGAAAYAHTRALTTKEMGGRKAGAPSGDLAAAYVAEKFRAAGLAPVGDNGSYFQSFTVPFIDLAAPPVFNLLSENGEIKQSFVHRVDYRESGQWLASDGRAEGIVVFLGRGTDRDIQKAKNLTGKIALVFQPPNQRVPEWAQALWRSGVAGLIVISNNADNVAFKSSFIGGSGRQGETHPLIVATRTVAEILLVGVGERLQDLEDRAGREGVAVETNSRVRIGVQVDIREAPTKNVVGALRGNDPAVSNEVIIVGGHYDHVGADPGGVLFEGANDNASGTAVVIALAEHFAKTKVQPRRTILFAAWSAEESGLLGSEHYVGHPLFPLAGTKAYINLDVVGAGLGDGLNITEDSVALAEQAKTAARDLGVRFAREATGGGSDHESFLRRGIPAVFLIWQRIGAIHTPSDTFDQIDQQKLKQTGQVSALLLLRLANQP